MAIGEFAFSRNTNKIFSRGGINRRHFSPPLLFLPFWTTLQTERAKVAITSRSSSRCRFRRCNFSSLPLWLVFSLINFIHFWLAGEMRYTLCSATKWDIATWYSRQSRRDCLRVKVRPLDCPRVFSTHTHTQISLWHLRITSYEFTS